MNEREMEYFLHDRGYTYLTMGRLTYLEINDLIKVHNKQQDEMKRASKRKR